MVKCSKGISRANLSWKICITVFVAPFFKSFRSFWKLSSKLLSWNFFVEKVTYKIDQSISKIQTHLWFMGQNIRTILQQKHLCRFISIFFLQIFDMYLPDQQIEYKSVEKSACKYVWWLYICADLIMLVDRLSTFYFEICGLWVTLKIEKFSCSYIFEFYQVCV